MTYAIAETPLWKPDPATVGDTRMAMFMQATDHEYYGDPVSYTHLDVYKRQRLGWAPERQQMPRSGLSWRKTRA